MLVIVFCSDLCISLILMILSLFLNFSKHENIWTFLKMNGYTEFEMTESFLY